MEYKEIAEITLTNISYPEIENITRPRKIIQQLLTIECIIYNTYKSERMRKSVSAASKITNRSSINKKKIEKTYKVQYQVAQYRVLHLTEDQGKMVVFSRRITRQKTVNKDSEQPPVTIIKI